MNSLDVVIFTTLDWWEYQRRPHYTALSKYARVLVVELPINFFTFIKEPYKLIEFLQGKKGLRQLSPSLYLYTPISIMPYGISFRSNFLSKINSNSFIIGLQNVLNKLNFRDWVQILFLPQQDGLQKILTPSLRCFEIVDECTTFFSPDGDLNSWFDQRMVTLEKKILAEVDIVFATSKSLYEAKKIYNPNCYYISNSAEVGHFAKAQDHNGAVPDDLSDIPSPRIGFVGHLTDFFEVDLLLYLSEKHPGWSFVLIGEDRMSSRFRNCINFVRLLSKTNIHWLGRRDYEVLPDYIRGFDVCTMLYQLRDRLRYSHPNKIYQYLASGKPIVSTDFPAVREYENLIEVAVNYDDFSKRLEKSLYCDSPNKRELRIAQAYNNSLDVRAKQKVDIFFKHLGKQNT